MNKGPASISGLIAAMLLSVMPASAAFAQQLDLNTPRQRSDTPQPRDAKSRDAKSRSVARPQPKASCAEFGAGFVRMESTGSCVRLGGGIDVGVGSSR